MIFIAIQNTLKALSDPIRREILNLLKSGRMSAGEISERFDVSFASISRHLSVLKDADLIRDCREGKFIFYEINSSVLEEVLTWILDLRGDDYYEKNKKIILTTIIIFLPIIAGLFLWNKLPDKLPIHWNSRGEIDGWCNKVIGVFLLPVVLSVLHLFSITLTLCDSKQDRVSKKIMSMLLWGMPLISIVTSFVMYSVSLGFKIDVTKIIYILVGFIFIMLGNYLPKNRQNNTVGYRIPWTLSSEENWIKTHRLGSKMFVLSGILFFISALVGRIEIIFIGIFIGIFIAIFIPVIYSYLLSRKVK